MEGSRQLSQIRLKLKAIVLGIDTADVREWASAGKKNCLVSKRSTRYADSQEAAFSK